MVTLRRNSRPSVTDVKYPRVVFSLTDRDLDPFLRTGRSVIETFRIENFLVWTQFYYCVVDVVDSSRIKKVQTRLGKYRKLVSACRTLTVVMDQVTVYIYYRSSITTGSLRILPSQTCLTVETLTRGYLPPVVVPYSRQLP